MKRRNTRTLLFMMLLGIILSFVIGPPRALAEEVETKEKVTTLFLINSTYEEAKLPEFYAAFDPDREYESIYADNFDDLIQKEENQNKIKEAGCVIIVGFRLEYDPQIEIKYHILTEAKQVNIASTENVPFVFREKLGAAVININDCWSEMYYARIAKTIKKLVSDSDTMKPTCLASFGLSAVLQKQVNQIDLSQADYLEYRKHLPETLRNVISKSTFKQCIKLFTGTFDPLSLYDDALIQPLTRDEASDQVYQIKQIKISGATYTPDFGIYGFEQRYDDHSLTAYDNCFLADYKDQVYAWDKKSKKYKLTKAFSMDEIGLKIVRWDGKKFTTKIYRYQDKVLRHNSYGDVYRDSKGNWYMDVPVGESVYLYKMNRQLQVLSKLNLTDLVGDEYCGFELADTDQILVYSSQTLGEYMERFYNPVKLIDLKKKKCVKEYKNGIVTNRIMRIADGKMYTVDHWIENIVVTDIKTGKILKVYPLKQIPEFTDSFEYSEDMGGKYTFTFQVYQGDIYLLKHTGIYKIDGETGKCSLLTEQTHEMFTGNEVVYTDFEVVDEKHFYVPMVYFDEHCAMYMYVITK